MNKKNGHNNNLKKKNMNSNGKSTKSVNKKRCAKVKPTVPIILSIIIIVFLLAIIYDAYFVELPEYGAPLLGKLGDFVFMYMGFGLLCLIWFIYLIVLVVAEEKK